MHGPVDAAAFAPALGVRWLADQPEVRHRTVDGALVFLDVSGFTALSERLAGRGRVGSEEVRDVIDATVRAILAEAFDLGGSLLKFGGDAVLVLFDGDAAVVRAAAAGHAMLAALLARNPVNTSGGQVTLGATVGVDAGPVDLVLAGGSHRELLVLGATTSRTIRTESAAAPDEVLVTPTVAAALDPAVLGMQERGVVPLVGRPAVVAPVRPEPDTSEVDAWQLVPAGLRRRLADGVPPGQHRRGTVAFVQVAGTDGLLASSDPAGIADELDRLVAVTQQACERHGVTWLASDVDVDGCKFILVAGVPHGDDDDNDRVIHVAREVAAVDGPLAVRVGVHRGPMFSGVVGPDDRLTYTVLGDAVNLAARAMGRAGPGQVLATAIVLNGLRTLYDVTMLEPFTVRGRTQPVRAGVVGAERGVRVRRRVDDTPFVGRRRELDHLVDALDAAARSGRGRVVEVLGPAGIGKSRLLDELADERSTVPVHLVACTRFSLDRPYRTAAMLLRLALTGERHGPGHHVLAAAREVLAGDEAAAWLPLLGTVYDVEVAPTAQTADLDPAHVSGRIRDLLGRLLLAAVPEHALLVIEDAQWMDPESRAMLDEAFMHLLQQRGWLVLLTAREPVDLVAETERLQLDPLPDDDALLLALEFVDQGVVPFEAAPELVRRAGGNPLFLTELARAGIDELPDDVESLVRRRLDELPPGAARLIAHAAVFGLEFPTLLAAVAADDPEVGSATADDVHHLLARMGSGYLRFRQSIYQEVAYEALPFRERRELHEQAAVTLDGLREQGEDVAVEALSRHHHLAGDRAGSWRWSREALGSAAARSATGSAIVFARRALDAARHLRVPTGERAAVWEQLGDLLEVAGGYDDALAAYRRARRLRRPSPALARRTGHVHERRGEYARARRWYGIAAAECQPDDEGERLRIAHRRLVCHVREGRPSEAIEAARALHDRAVAHGDPLALGYLHYVRAWAGSLLGDEEHPVQLQEAGRCFEQAGDLKGQVLVLNEFGVTAYWTGEWDDAVALYREARGLLERLGDVAHAAGSDANIGEVRSDQGRLDEAREVLTGALRRLEVSGQLAALVFARQMLGRTAARAGDAEAATRWYQEALELTEGAGADGLRRDVLVREAELAAFRGSVEEVEALAPVIEAIPEPGPDVIAVHERVRGIAAWQAGAGEDAARRLRISRATAAEAGLRYEEGMTAAAAGHLLDDRTAAADADTLLAPLGLVLPPARLAVGPWLADDRDGAR